MSPRKPSKPCNAPACPNLTDDRYFEEHKQQRRRQGAPRQSATQRGYDRQWRKLRNVMLARRMGEKFNFDVGKAAASMGVTVDLEPDAVERRKNREVRAAYYPNSKRIAVFDAASHGETVALIAHELAHAVMNHTPGANDDERAAQEAAAETFAKAFLGL